MTSEERRAALDAIANEVRACDRCRLAAGRTQAVPGEGNPDTEVVFVGEGPGQTEDRLGRPFVGPAGSLLDELLALVDWRREDVFITNVVKCRPPGNRDPEADEMAACRPFLRRQLEALDPALVVTLGRFSLQTFMPGEGITRVHGTTRPLDRASGAPGATGYAMYHPAAALRQAGLKETMQRDMAAVPAALVASRDAREARAAREACVGAAGAAAAGAAEAAAAPVADGGPGPSAGEIASDTWMPPGDAGSDVPGDQLGLF